MAAQQGKAGKKGISSLAGNSNASLAVGGLFALSSFACPCPFCYISSATFLINGVAGKISGVKPKAMPE